MSDKDPTLLYLLGGVALLTGYLAYQNFKSKEHHKEIRRSRTPQLAQSKEILLKRQVSVRAKDTALQNELKVSAEQNIKYVPHLADIFEDEECYVSPLLGDGRTRSVHSGGEFLPESSFVKEGEFVLGDKSYFSTSDVLNAVKYLRGGPRKCMYFRPEVTRVAIVTCGGLCPGLNVVIREIVMSLWYNYGVKEIYGIKWGYKGFYEHESYWTQLTPMAVKSIHNLGGTILGSSRGGFDGQKIVDAIEARGINQLYCIGGDGTHRGILALMDELKKRKLKCAIIGVPKTVDNDIPLIDKSFGFDSAIEQGSKMIDCANTEACSAQYGVGLVKLMGRNSGFLTLGSALASRDVNFCLIPEFKFDLYGSHGFMENLIERLKEKDHAVIVVAEGCDDAVNDVNIGSKGEKDPSGNVKHADIGVFLRSEIPRYGKEKHGMEITLKYIDPTYAVRSVAANSSDKILCAKLAQSAVHGGMAGYTGFSIGMIRGALVMIPIEELSRLGTNRIQADDRNWQRILSSTGQRKFLLN